MPAPGLIIIVPVTARRGAETGPHNLTSTSTSTSTSVAGRQMLDAATIDVKIFLVPTLMTILMTHEILIQHQSRTAHSGFSFKHR